MDPTTGSASTKPSAVTVTANSAMPRGLSRPSCALIASLTRRANDPRPARHSRGQENRGRAHRPRADVVREPSLHMPLHASADTQLREGWAMSERNMVVVVVMSVPDDYEGLPLNEAIEAIGQAIPRELWRSGFVAIDADAERVIAFIDGMETAA
jgi:hypothetical protein